LQMERKSGGLIRGYLASKRQDASAAARRASGARYDQFMAPRDGMSAWIDGLIKNLPAGSVQLNSSIAKLEPTVVDSKRQWQATTSNGQIFQADGVVVATPAAVTAKLLASVSSEAAKIVGDIPYASSAVVAMIVQRDQIRGRLDGFGLVVPSCENRQALAISFTSNKYPGRTPDDQVLLRVFLGGALRGEVVDRSDAELQALAAAEVREILNWSGQGLNWQAVIRWKNAMPQYLVGHVARMQQLQQHLSAEPTLQLCGAAYNGVGIPQCVRSGRQAAQKLLEQFAAG
jgi:protoporphyrinogen/coproporphyrinogen III oxidase